MIRHISMFSFQDVPEKEENVAALGAFLTTIPQKVCGVLDSQIRRALPGAPALPDDAPVMFPELIQILDFSTPTAAAAYPTSSAHTELMTFSQGMLKKVVAFDYSL